VVTSMCDRLLVMWQGRIVERGPVVEVLTAPRHEHTRQLLADADLAVREPDLGGYAPAGSDPVVPHPVVPDTAGERHV
jgi:ABC-type glutathione transport system ATPase component